MTASMRNFDGVTVKRLLVTRSFRGWSHRSVGSSSPFQHVDTTEAMMRRYALVSGTFFGLLAIAQLTRPESLQLTST